MKEAKVGMTVLHETGQSYSDNRRRSLVKITKVLSSGFRIKGSNYMFSLIDGSRKGLTGRMDMGTIDTCTVLTDEEANSYRKTWAESKRRRVLIDVIMQALDKSTIVKLEEIARILGV